MAVVQGVIKEDGTVDAPIGRHKTDRKKMCVTTEKFKRGGNHYSSSRLTGTITLVRLRLEREGRIK